MTREEAIEILRDTPIDIRSTREDDIHTLYATAQNMAIEALQTIDNCDQCEWCCPSDGIPTIHVVRCKDCKHYHKSEMYSYCDAINVKGRSPKKIDFCSYGERKGGDDE